MATTVDATAPQRWLLRRWTEVAKELLRVLSVTDELAKTIWPEGTYERSAGHGMIDGVDHADPRHRADYRTILGWAVEQAHIDPRQIIAWVTSSNSPSLEAAGRSGRPVAGAVSKGSLKGP
jgi:hypothetical protein